MSLNKYMHPRNIYRVPPNFKQLAINCPEFRKFAKQDLSGKVSVDFKNQESLLALTNALLQRDFQLKLSMPSDRLVPTVPLRLNYILWIEDLMRGKKDVYGIDIGAGASCIYPLLAAKKNKWKMLATEMDETCITYANRNISENGLDKLITVVSVPEGRILVDVLDPNKMYDFCMCNPPFFSNESELNMSHNSRSPGRNPPRNAHTGCATELVTEGGEVAFVLKIISDSLILQQSVRIYTVMLGHKGSVFILQNVLKDLKGANNFHLSVATSQFCQGNTMRWGLAWTFDPRLRLEVESVLGHNKKAKPPIVLNLKGYTFRNAVNELNVIFNNLQMSKYVFQETNNVVAMQLVAMSNTWIHQRKKRRTKATGALETENTEGPAKKQMKIAHESANAVQTNGIKIETGIDRLTESNVDMVDVENCKDCDIKPSDINVGKLNNTELGKQVFNDSVHSNVHVDKGNNSLISAVITNDETGTANLTNTTLVNACERTTETSTGHTTSNEVADGSQMNASEVNNNHNPTQRETDLVKSPDVVTTNAVCSKRSLPVDCSTDEFKSKKSKTPDTGENNELVCNKDLKHNSNEKNTKPTLPQDCTKAEKIRMNCAYFFTKEVASMKDKEMKSDLEMNSKEGELRLEEKSNECSTLNMAAKTITDTTSNLESKSNENITSGTETKSNETTLNIEVDSNKDNTSNRGVNKIEGTSDVEMKSNEDTANVEMTNKDTTLDVEVKSNETTSPKLEVKLDEIKTNIETESNVDKRSDVDIKPNTNTIRQVSLNVGTRLNFKLNTEPNCVTPATSSDPLIVIDVIIRNVNTKGSGDNGRRSDYVFLEISRSSGTGGWDLLHQLKQYLNNQLFL